MNRFEKIKNDALWSLDYQKGVDEINVAIEKFGESAIAFYCLGILYDHLVHGTDKKKEKTLLEKKARNYYQQALKQDPDFAQAYYGMGRILLNKGDKRALVWYQRALDTNPKDSKLQYNFAYACNVLGLLEQAEKMFKRLLKKDGPSFGLFYNLAQVKSKEGKQKDAKKYAESGLKLFGKLAKKVRQSPGGIGFRDCLKKITE